MTILTIQRRLHERGRIRLGRKVPAGNGKSRPEKLDRFRLTSSDRPALDAAAQLWGGTVEPWQSPSGPQHELVTNTTDIAVVVPPSEMAFSQHMELWSGGGCVRRCDGAEMGDGSPCACVAADDQQCKPTTRLSVILPELPGIGLWRVESHGWYAASELAGTLALLESLAGSGRISARLQLQQRMVLRGGKTHKFAVPVLDLDVRVTDVVPVAPAASAQLAAPVATAPTPAFTPIDTAALPPGPQPTVAEQVQAVADTPERVARRGAAPPMPATGVRPPLRAGGGDSGPEPAAAPEEGREPKATQAQMRKIHASGKDLGLDHDAIRDRASSILRRPVESLAAITKTDANRIIEALGAEAAKAGTPAAASGAQTQAILAIAAKQGLTDADLLEVASAVLGREVDANTRFNGDEAAALIAHLQEVPA